MAKVGMDAGHGGFGVTPGKRTPDGEYEWSFNNIVLLAAKAKLESNGVEVVRTDDPTGKTDVPLATRTNRANAAKVDVYVSIHHNANTGKWGEWTGTETFTYLGSQPKSEKLAKEVQPRLVKAYGLKDRGLKKANFHIVRETKMPAILVEGGYMDSVIDIKKMRDLAVLRAAGEAIADGILAYFGIIPKAAPAPQPVTESPKPAPAPAPQPAPKPTPAPVGDSSLAGKRVESIYKGADGLNFYSKPSFDTKYKVGTFGFGIGWTIVRKLDGMYEVKNSKGSIFYVTASPTYVKVEGASQPAPAPKPAPAPAPKPAPAPAPKPAGIPVVGHIKIVGVKNAAIICNRPSSTSSKNLGTIGLGKTIAISGSVPGWFEVIYNGERAYVNAKYGVRV